VPLTNSTSFRMLNDCTSRASRVAQLQVQACSASSGGQPLEDAHDKKNLDID